MDTGTVPAPPELEAQTLQEIAFSRDDLQEAMRRMYAIQAAVLAVYLSVLAWVVSRALPAAEAAAVTDATIWALRERGDLALAVFLLAPVGLLLLTIMLHASAVATVLDARLNRLYSILNNLPGRYHPRQSVQHEPFAAVWLFASLTAIALYGLVLTAAAYAFFWPAVDNSSTLWWARALGIGCMLLSTLLASLHTYGAVRHHRADQP